MKTHVRPFTRLKTRYLLSGLMLASGLVLMAAGWDVKAPYVKQPATTVTHESCMRSCSVNFNYCKLTNTVAASTCDLEVAACTKTCPAPVTADEGLKPLINEGPQIVGLECQPEILTPVRPGTTYLIVTRSMFVDGLRPFVAAKRAAGETVQTLLIEQIVCSEPGADVPEKIRNYLRRLSAASTVTKRPVYVLLVGAPRQLSDIRNLPQIQSYGVNLKTPWEVPMRYIYPLSSGLEPIPTDQYYASVSVEWDTTLAPYYRSIPDGSHGGWLDRGDHWAARFDFSTQFSVGRVPVRTVTDLTHWVQKTLAWRVPQVFKESTFITSACRSRQESQEEIWEDAATHRVNYHACQTDDGGDIANYANRELPDLITSYSHGTYDEIITWPFTSGYSFSTSSPGMSKAPILFIHGCEVGGVDFPQLSLAESSMKRRDGTVAVIASTRSHWDNEFPFPDSVFHKGRLTLGEAFYSAKRDVVSQSHLSYRLLDNLFMYTLYGDPQLQVVNPSIKITPSSPTAFIPAQTDTETFDLPLRIKSLVTDRVLFGQLYLKNYTGDTVLVPALSTMGATLHSPSGLLGYPGRYPIAQSVQFFRRLPVLFSSQEPIRFPHTDSRACNTELMSCISPAITISAPLQMGCGRLRHEFNYLNGFYQPIGRHSEVKVINQDSSLYSAPVSFTLLTRLRGYYPSADAFLDQTRVELARISSVRPLNGAMYTFDFDLNRASELNTGTRPGMIYADATYEVYARDAENRVVGYCRYSFEPSL